MVSEHRVKLHFLLIIFWVSLLLFSKSLIAQDCKDVLEDVIENFGVQNYNEVIVLLSVCPPENIIDKTQKTLAYELLAFSYFTIDQGDSAKNTLNRLLDIQPAYSPQPSQYPDTFIELVDALKNERTSIYSKTWFWIGSVTAVALTAILIFQDKGEQGTLPDAPDPPN